jgi:EAL domain-containing protein (putative c-di-GMP-specific phosphodiesterase class I)
MGLTVVAEGVEDEFQHHALQLSGCSHMQGYRFGMPVSAEEAGQSVSDAAGSPGRRTAA